MHCGIRKLFSTNNFHDKTMCRKQEPCCLVKSQGHSSLLNVVPSLGFSETCSCPSNNFIMRGRILKNKLADFKIT